MTLTSKSLKERELKQRREQAKCIAWIISLGPGCESLQIKECLDRIHITTGRITAQIQTLRTKIIHKEYRKTELTPSERIEIKDEYVRITEQLEPMIVQMKGFIDKS